VLWDSFWCSTETRLSWSGRNDVAATPPCVSPQHDYDTSFGGCYSHDHQKQAFKVNKSCPLTPSSRAIKQHEVQLKRKIPNEGNTTRLLSSTPKKGKTKTVDSNQLPNEPTRGTSPAQLKATAENTPGVIKNGTEACNYLEKKNNGPHRHNAMCTRLRRLSPGFRSVFGFALD
jgi:hypothetical protein